MLLVTSVFVGAATDTVGVIVPDVTVVPSGGATVGVLVANVENAALDTTEYQVQVGLDVEGVVGDVGVDFVNSEEVFNAKIQLDNTGAIGIANIANGRTGTPYLVLKPYSAKGLEFVVGGMYNHGWDLIGAVKYDVTDNFGVAVEYVDGVETACLILEQNNLSLLAGRGLESGNDAWFAKVGFEL